MTAGPAIPGGELALTVSVGVAAGLPTTERALVELADAALYTAKDGGRNQVVLAPDEQAVAVPV